MPSMPPSFYILAVVVLAAGGVPKGYDEGGFSASVTLPAFKDDFGLTKTKWHGTATGLANRTANITSFGVLGAAIGAIIAFFLNDKLGRLWSYRLAILVWASGIFMQVFSSGILSLLLFARVWGGLGAGGLTVISPLFLSEIAPARTRGMIVSMYMVTLLSFLSLGFFVNYGVSKHMAVSRAQWQIVQAIPLIPVGIAFALSFLLPESPRWLATRSRTADSLAALAKPRGLLPTDPRLASEHARVLLEADITTEVKSASLLTTARECLTTPSLRSRYLLLVAMHIIAQWTGGNGITYYISSIFQYAGIVGPQTSLITSGAYGLVKLFVTMIFAWVLIDKIGRRRCFLAGLTLQAASHIYMSIYFGGIGQGNSHASAAAVASVFVYAIGWSIGLCTIPYIYGAEIFPTRTRSFAYATTMALHWFCQFAVVRVTPVMLVALDKYGAYVFWACVCVAGIVILGLWAPETKGVPIERMGELFERRWWRCGRARLEPVVDGVEVGSAKEEEMYGKTGAGAEQKKGTVLVERRESSLSSMQSSSRGK